MMRKLSSSRNLREALDSDDEEPCFHKKDQKNKTIYKKIFQKNKKNLYSKEGSEDVEVLFMGFESKILE